MSTAIARLVPSSRCENDGRLWSQAAALVSMGIWSCDLSDDTLEWGDGVFELFGLERHRHPDRREALELYCEPYREKLERLRSHAISTCSSFSMDAQIRRPDGTFRWMKLTATTAVSNDRPTRLFGIKQDITAQKEEWERLRRLAENDPLTGLANRARFHSEFLDLSKGSSGLARVGALVLFDLNNLKSVNDRWGHAAGDRHISEFAGRLAFAFPEAMLVSRIGGDEFAVVFPSRLSASRCEQLVRSRLNAISACVYIAGEAIPLGVCAGMAVNGKHGGSPEALFAAADAALYAAKRTGCTALCLAPRI